MSSFTWLDYSEQEKQKMLDVIDRFREHDTRDELGIASVRDGFADMFFPGTSTIQTRARYFLIVPWVYLNLERRQISSQHIASLARRDELSLVQPLAISDDSTGTIGVLARTSLKRLPSNIYWQGLHVWGIRLFHDSQDQYHRKLDAFYLDSAAAKRQITDDGDLVDGYVPRHWHAGLPPPPEGFPKKLSLTLTYTEAKYLRDRILSCVPGTLLARLLDEGTIYDATEFPWQHPGVDHLPAALHEQLQHARNFSEVMHGAALLYNYMLAELTERTDLMSQYEARLDNWFLLLKERRTELEHWDRNRFWLVLAKANARVGQPTRVFIDTWLDLALQAIKGGTLSSLYERGRRLIRTREQALKGTQARVDSTRARELWNGSAGTTQLNYRWGTAQTMLTDILRGLEAKPHRGASR